MSPLDGAPETEHEGPIVSKVTFSLHASVSQRGCLKYSRDRGLEAQKVLIESLPPQGFSSSHSLPGHMLGIPRGWAWLWGRLLETLSWVRAHMFCSRDRVTDLNPAWGSGRDLTELFLEKKRALPLATCPTVWSPRPSRIYANPRSIVFLFHKKT